MSTSPVRWWDPVPAGQTPLLLALRQGYINVARLLVDRGADVNVPDRDNETPFSCVLHTAYGEAGRFGLRDGSYFFGLDAHEAAATALRASLRKAYRDMANALVSHGVNVNPRDNDGGTPLHYTARAGDEKLATPLHEAALRGHREIVELLLAHDADIRVKNSRGRTPLDEAVRRRHSEIVRLLTATAGSPTIPPDRIDR